MGDLDVQQQALLEKNIIDIQGPVDNDMFEYVRECILELRLKDCPPISITITSNGGKASFGLFIYDLLRHYPGEKTGIVIGVAQSMAAIILQACEHRQCSRNSFIMIHDVRRNEVTYDQVHDKKKREELEKSIWSTQEEIYSILKNRTKKSPRAIAALCKKERELSAQEALAFGLIDEII